MMISTNQKKPLKSNPSTFDCQRIKCYAVRTKWTEITPENKEVARRRILQKFIDAEIDFEDPDGSAHGCFRRKKFNDA